MRAFLRTVQILGETPMLREFDAAGLAHESFPGKGNLYACTGAKSPQFGTLTGFVRRAALLASLVLSVQALDSKVARMRTKLVTTMSFLELNPTLWTYQVGSQFAQGPSQDLTRSQESNHTIGVAS